MNENQDIIKIVMNQSPRGQELIDKIFSHYKSFEEFLFLEIKLKWEKDRPQDFIICNAVGEEYNKCNQSAYSWYMKVINGSLPSNVYDKLSDAAFHQNGSEVIENRINLYKSLIESDNIIMWCIENIRI